MVLVGRIYFAFMPVESCFDTKISRQKLSNHTSYISAAALRLHITGKKTLNIISNELIFWGWLLVLSEDMKGFRNYH